MKLESVKKHEQSSQHKDAEVAQRASARPYHTPMKLIIQTIEQNEVKQMNPFSTLHFTSWKLSTQFVISLLCCSFKG